MSFLLGALLGGCWRNCLGKEESNSMISKVPVELKAQFD